MMLRSLRGLPCSFSLDGQVPYAVTSDKATDNRAIPSVPSPHVSTGLNSL